MPSLFRPLSHARPAGCLPERSCWIWLALLWLALASTSRAEAPALSALPDQALGRYLGILPETEQALTLAEVIAQQQQGKFTSTEQTAPKFGIGSPPVWLHLAVRNDSDQDVRRQLQLEISWLDRIEVYHTQGTALIGQWLAGDGDAAFQHPLPGLGYVFDLQLPPGRNDIYLRLATTDPLLTPLRLLDTAQAAALKEQHDYGYGLLYGFLLALIAYNAMLFIGLRERGYLDYTLYLGSFVILHLAYTGHAYAWLWPGQAIFQQYAIPLLMVTFSCLGLRFASGFLNLRQHAPLAHRLVYWLIVAILGLIFGAVLLRSPQAAVTIAFLFVLIFSVTMVWLGIITIRHGRVAGRYFIAAALTTLLGSTTTALAVWQGLPYSTLAFHAAGWGVVFEGILLALALAYRMRQHQQARLQAEQLARTDPLTSLLNRRAFFEHAGPLWSAALRNQRPLSVIMADIDHFKSINDNHGHATGDKVLAAVSRRLAEACRNSDLAARWGGEEFVMLLQDTDARQAAQLAERLRAEIEGLKLGPAGYPPRLSASFGIAQLGEHESLDQLIREADQWLYQAKQNGRNRVAGSLRTENA